MSLEPGRWSELERLFHEALARPPAERTAFADEACGPDQALRDELARLLAADEGADPAIARIVGEGARAVAGSLPGGPSEDARLGPYRLIRELARGGMGTVWLAERADDEFRRSVAIKLILPGAAGAGVVPRFLAERQILAGLDHPNIARLLDGGTTPEGWPYLVMEHIEGEPIDRYCERHGLDLEARLGLFVAVCSAVQFAHAEDRDFKGSEPSNVEERRGDSSEGIAGGEKLACSQFSGRVRVKGVLLCHGRTHGGRGPSDGRTGAEGATREGRARVPYASQDSGRDWSNSKSGTGSPSSSSNSGVWSKESSAWGGPRAGIRGGGLRGRSRWRRIDSTVGGSVRKARIFISPPQAGHRSGSTS
jgi:hypothetical protein